MRIITVSVSVCLWMLYHVVIYVNSHCKCISVSVDVISRSSICE